MFELSYNEEMFCEKLEDASRLCRGELEMNYDEVAGGWVAKDYIKSYGCSLTLGVHDKKYFEPLITTEEAEENLIDVRKCFDTFGCYVVG